MRVLMVEDESEVARVVTRRLNRLGFEADCVSTLRDAREALDGAMTVLLGVPAQTLRGARNA